MIPSLASSSRLSFSSFSSWGKSDLVSALSRAKLLWAFHACTNALNSSCQRRNVWVSCNWKCITNDFWKPLIKRSIIDLLGSSIYFLLLFGATESFYFYLTDFIFEYTTKFYAPSKVDFLWTSFAEEFWKNLNMQIYQINFVL